MPCFLYYKNNSRLLGSEPYSMNFNLTRLSYRQTLSLGLLSQREFIRVAIALKSQAETFR